ncbi:MAG: carbohydrate kinase [Oscillospiraceae bacterium]|nr:carbohydrate kinase [Oscillospiraceae bacterium]
MSNKKLYAIGEALIDFIPGQTGCAFSEVKSFSPALGGAPANVCGAFTRLGGKSEMITQLGDDPFGHKIADELKEYGVGTGHICFTKAANTALAFVSLGKNGERTFSFYRSPSADMLLTPEQIERPWFDDAFALHYCSVSLGDTPMKRAHEAAIRYAKEAGAIISFDPNLRFSLWQDADELRRVVLSFIPCSHVLKISDEELKFLTGTADIQKALPQLFLGDVQLILYTCGKEGAWAFTRSAQAFSPADKQTRAVDTTGAGDAFAGSFLYSLAANNITAHQLAGLSEEELYRFLAFSNRCCDFSVQRHGALASYPKQSEVQEEF